MKDTFTREEVYHLLLAIVMFSSANKNQGLAAMTNEDITFGDKVIHLLSVADNIDLNSPKSTLSTVMSIKMK